MSFLEITTGHNFVDDNFVMMLRNDDNFFRAPVVKSGIPSFFNALLLKKDDVIKMRDFLTEVLNADKS